MYNAWISKSLFILQILYFHCIMWYITHGCNGQIFVIRISMMMFKTRWSLLVIVMLFLAVRRGGGGWWLVYYIFAEIRIYISNVCTTVDKVVSLISAACALSCEYEVVAIWWMCCMLHDSNVTSILINIAELDLYMNCMTLPPQIVVCFNDPIKIRTFEL